MSKKQKTVLLLGFLASCLIIVTYAMTRSTDNCETQRHTTRKNTFSVTDPACRIQVQMDGRLFSFPAMFVTSAGEWMPQAGAYRDPVALSISGRDFATPAYDAHPREALKTVELFVNTVPDSSGRALPDIYVRDGAHGKTDLLAAATFPVTPNPDRDRFGLVALRSDLSGELFVGRSRDGRAIFFDCSPDHPRMEPLCKRRYHRHGIAVHYWFAKRYLADWQFFDQGVTGLLDQHKVRQR